MSFIAQSEVNAASIVHGYLDYLDTLDVAKLEIQLKRVETARDTLSPNSATNAKEYAEELHTAISARIAAFAEQSQEPAVLPLATYGVEEHLDRFPQY